MDRMCRLKEIIGDKKKGEPGLIPVSKSAWWKGVKEGRFPQPVKLAVRTTCWRLSDIQNLIQQGGGDLGD